MLDLLTTHRDTEAPRFEGLPADISEALARFRDRLGGFFVHASWQASVASTNDVARSLAEQGCPEGTIVGADMQTSGRGRQGRSWASPLGAGLYVSVIVRPPQPAANLVTIAAGVAIAEGIREATGLEVSLKWPNDVYVSGRKLAGILAEAETSSSRVNFVVLGFGINLLTAAYPEDVAHRATSLEFELGRPVDRGLVLAACLATFVARYRQLTRLESNHVIAAWRVFGAATLGRPVECVLGERRVSGIAEAIDLEGALLVRSAEGLIRIVSGEVQWR